MTMAEMTRYEGADEVLSGGRLRGDDLDAATLDDLWRICLGEPTSDPYVAGWWEDKPYQVLIRLVARLTRAEAALDAAKGGTP